MPDGTVVRVNKTIIHDTSEDGSSFFFHQTSFHNFGPSDENVEDVSLEEEKDDEVQKTTKFDEFPISSSTTSGNVADVSTKFFVDRQTLRPSQTH